MLMYGFNTVKWFQTETFPLSQKEKNPRSGIMNRNVMGIAIDSVIIAL